jgi:hypothetical protein
MLYFVLVISMDLLPFLNGGTIVFIACVVGIQGNRNHLSTKIYRSLLDNNMSLEYYLLLNDTINATDGCVASAYNV